MKNLKNLKTKFSLLCPVILATSLLYADISLANSRPTDIKEIKTQRLAREIASKQLKDPKSAEFRNQNGLCGEVNAKNSFGGYAGFKRFIAINKELALIEGDGQVDEEMFNRVWNEACK